MSFTYQETELYESAKIHLRSQYRGIFPDNQIEEHLHNYVELKLSEEQYAEILGQADLKRGQKLVDLGCGFGSFVLVCRKHGVQAIGLDVADFDIDFARNRFAQVIPGSDIDSIYLKRNAESTQMEEAGFDVVTAWNLLEHVPNFKKVIGEAFRLLKPGGLFFGIAPNYLAVRKEAHYLVPWLPLFPRRLASLYLRLLGRRPDFFEQHIYYVTNWGILASLKKTGFELVYPNMIKVDRPELIKSSVVKQIVTAAIKLRLKPVIKWMIALDYRNPFKSAVSFIARKQYE